MSPKPQVVYNILTHYSNNNKKTDHQNTHHIAIQYADNAYGVCIFAIEYAQAGE